MHTDTHPHTQGPGTGEGVPSAEDVLRREGSCLQLCLPSLYVLTPHPGRHPKNGAVQFLRKKKKKKKNLKINKSQSLCAEGQRSASSRPPRGFVSCILQDGGGSCASLWRGDPPRACVGDKRAPLGAGRAR